jgi:hypothetical protein
MINEIRNITKKDIPPMEGLAVGLKRICFSEDCCCLIPRV